MPSFDPAGHLCLLAEKLEAVERGELKRLMVFMPPRHGKTELCSIRFPAWYLGKHPQKSIIGCSYAENLSYTISYAIRETISTNRYQKLWPTQLDTAGAIRWQIAGKEDKRASYIAAGVGGGITGEGADLLIIDDPVKNAEEAESQTYRDRAFLWYRTTARTRLQPNAAIIFIMTRWHVDDLAGRLLAEAQRDSEADQWHVINLPALKDDLALWANRYPVPALQSTRATIGSRAFESLYQGNPVQASGNIFKREWWQYYRERPAFQYTVHSWDTAFKEKAQNDYSVCTVWGVTQTGWYLIDVVRDRVEFPELKRMAIAAYERDKPQRVLIEDKASGQSLVQELERKTRIPVFAVKVDGDKVARANAVTPLVEAGRVFLPQYASWLHDYVEELSAFPAGEHDDQVDSTTLMLNYAARPIDYSFGFAGETRELDESP